MIANILSWVISVFNAFYWNNRYVFKIVLHGVQRLSEPIYHMVFLFFSDVSFYISWLNGVEFRIR